MIWRRENGIFMACICPNKVFLHTQSKARCKSKNSESPPQKRTIGASDICLITVLRLALTSSLVPLKCCATLVMASVAPLEKSKVRKSSQVWCNMVTQAVNDESRHYLTERFSKRKWA